MVLRMSETGNDLPPDVAPPAGEIGAAAITRHLRTLPMGPGVYRMIDGAGEILYIGKARSLRKRVTSYTKPTGLSIRIQRSEEHTSELQSLMRNSYAAFCLKQQTKINYSTTNQQN